MTKSCSTSKCSKLSYSERSSLPVSFKESKFENRHPVANSSASPKLARNAPLVVSGLLGLYLGLCPAAMAQPLQSLSFPVDGDTAYTAPITSVLDHEGTEFYSSGDLAVRAYSGELGKAFAGFTCGPSGQPCGFYNPSFEDFQVNGNYLGYSGDGSDAKKVLTYRGHPGYDYPYSGGTAVLAPANGYLYIPATDTINSVSTDPWCKFHTAYINHGGGLTTWYLHLQAITLAGSPLPHSCPGSLTSDEPMGLVQRGSEFATVGDFCSGCSVGDHLHFEVRLCDTLPGGRVDTSTCRAIDPYGWEWPGGDPLASHGEGAVLSLEPLWEGAHRPIVEEVTLSPIAGGVTATVLGSGFTTGAVVNLWDRLGNFIDKDGNTFTPHSLTTTTIDVDLTIGLRDPTDFVLKVESQNGARSRGVVLPETGVSESIGIALIGSPSPDGGTFQSFQSIYDVKNSGDLFFFGITTIGPNTFVHSAGEVRVAEAPNGDDVSVILVNNSGDYAYRTEDQGFGFPVYFLPSGESEATQIVDTGDPVPGMSGYEFDLPIGPIALGEEGTVAFTTGVINPDDPFEPVLSHIFVHRKTTGSLLDIVRDGELSPTGGTFDIDSPTRTGLTDDGSVVFLSNIVGGPAPYGYFLADSSSGSISKIVEIGDPAPLPAGGTHSSLLWGAVAGESIVFKSQIDGGAAQEAIFLTPDLRTPEQRLVVAYQGQETGTDVGGRFSLPGDPSVDNHPFRFGDTPKLRRDGKVLFYAELDGALLPDSSTPTNEGLFLWDGQEFERVVAQGEILANGDTIEQLNPGGVFVSSDSGLIFYSYRKD